MSSVEEPSAASPEPWEELQQLVEAGAVEEVQRQLESLPPGETARVLSRLDEEDQAELLAMLPPHDAGQLIDSLPDAQAAQLIDQLTTEQAAAVVSSLESDDQADILGRLDERDAEAILNVMAPDDAANARRLTQWPEDCAGGLMITEMLSYFEGDLIEDVLDDLRANGEKYARYDVQYAYVVNETGQLIGVLRMRDLLLSSRRTPIAGVMIENPLSVPVSLRIDELNRFFDRHPLFGGRWSTTTNACWASSGVKTWKKPPKSGPTAPSSSSWASSAAKSCATCRCGPAHFVGCRGSASTSCSTSWPPA